ncbi:MAG: hypothetical protein AAGH64_03060 [Planctomycetota bacterium]
MNPLARTLAALIGSICLTPLAHAQLDDASFDAVLDRWVELSGTDWYYSTPEHEVLARLLDGASPDDLDAQQILTLGRRGLGVVDTPLVRTLRDLLEREDAEGALAAFTHAVFMFEGRAWDPDQTRFLERALRLFLEHPARDTVPAETAGQLFWDVAYEAVIESHPAARDAVLALGDRFIGFTLDFVRRARTADDYANTRYAMSLLPVAGADSGEIRAVRDAAMHRMRELRAEQPDDAERYGWLIESLADGQTSPYFVEGERATLLTSVGRGADDPDPFGAFGDAVVVLHFFEPREGGVVEGIDTLRAIANAYDGAPVRIVSVWGSGYEESLVRTITEGRNRAKLSLLRIQAKGAEMTWDVAAVQGRLAEEYGITQTPLLAVVGLDGIVERTSAYLLDDPDDVRRAIDNALIEAGITTPEL